VIQYIGGKYQQSPWMYELAPKRFKKYGEVFGGAMWFYIRTDVAKGCKKIYYNDFDPYMCNLFLCFKQHDEILKRLSDVPTCDTDVFAKMLKVIQDNQNFEFPNLDIGAAHIYLIAHVFSGMTGSLRNPKCKMMNKGYSFKTMDGHAVLKRLRKPEIREKLEKIEVSNLSYEQFIPMVDSEDTFLYIDPPYWKTESYYKEGDFNYTDHERLATMLANSKCKWMLSYYNYPELNDWYPRKKYVWKLRKYKKMAAAFKDKKMPTGEEVIVMNYGKERDKLSVFFGG
jgi:DNA adenine methylase